MALHKAMAADEAVFILKQHEMPCIDCPFARASLKGWLGGSSVEEWIECVHGEGRIECHATRGKGWQPQCAGAAIYRANVCKQPRDPALLMFPPNRQVVFSTPQEFKDHHERRKSKRR